MPACSSSPIDLLVARIGSTSDRVTVTGIRREAHADEPADLVAALAKVPDPRSRRGIGHRLVTVLALAVCAVLAGARSYVAIAEWAHDLPLGVRIRLGLTVRRATPSESAIRRILQKVNSEALDRVLADWLVARANSISPSIPDPPEKTPSEKTPPERSAPARSAPERSAPERSAPERSAPGKGAGSGPAPIGPPRQRVIAVDGKSARGARQPMGVGCTCSRRSTPAAGSCWANRWSMASRTS